MVKTQLEGDHSCMSLKNTLLKWNINDKILISIDFQTGRYLLLFFSLIFYILYIILNFQISYGSTAPTLSDTSKYPLFLRTIPSDAAFNSARIALMRKFRWTRVGLIKKNEISYSAVRL